MRRNSLVLRYLRALESFKNTTSTAYQQCMLKMRNSKFKLLVTLLNNAQAGKRVNVTGSSHLAGVSPIFENTERMKKSVQLTQRVVQLQKKTEHLSTVRRYSKYCIT